MATLLNEATDAWSFDKLITQIPGELNELLTYLNGKHTSYQHDHINVIALSRVLIALKFVSSKKRLLTQLKPTMDSLITLCHEMLSTMRSEKHLSKSSPWLWLDTILSIVHTPDLNNNSDAHRNHNNNHNNDRNQISSTLNVSDLSKLLSSKLTAHTEHGHDEIPQFLIPEWCFTTTSGIKLFEHNFKSQIAGNQQNKTDDGMSGIKMDSDSDSDSEDDDDLESSLFGESKSKKKKNKNSKQKEMESNTKKENESTKSNASKSGVTPTSRTLSKVDFLSFPRPKPPQSATSKSTPSSAAIRQMRKRQKTGLSSFTTVGGNETDRRRKVSAIADRLKQRMNKKNEKKNTMLLSLQQKRQMKEDNDRREQERRYQLEMARIEKERVKKMEKERIEREQQEKQQKELMKTVMANNAATDDLDDFDAFMDDLGGPGNGTTGPSPTKSDGGGPGALTLMMEPASSQNSVQAMNAVNTMNNQIPALSVNGIGTGSGPGPLELNVSNGSNGVNGGNASASSGDESLDDLLVAPGSEIPSVLKKESKNENDQNGNAAKTSEASAAATTSNGHGNGQNGTKRIVHSQRELDHYRLYYPDYYKQYMASQPQTQNASNNVNAQTKSTATVKTETQVQAKAVPVKKAIDPEEARLCAMGIPKALHRFKWLHTDCNQLNEENRKKIVHYLTGRYTKKGVEKEDVLLNRTVEAGTGIIKDSIFRMVFATKNWKKVVLKKRMKKKAVT